MGHFQKLSTPIFNKQQRLTYRLSGVDVLELLAQLKRKEYLNVKGLDSRLHPKNKFFSLHHQSSTIISIHGNSTLPSPLNGVSITLLEPKFDLSIPNLNQTRALGGLQKSLSQN